LSQLAWAHAHEILIWAGKGSRHTFNYDLVNGPDPTSKVSSVWRIPTVPRREKLHGHHPTQKRLRLVRRALLASAREGELVLDPFCGSGTTAVTAKQLERFFVGAELEEEFCELAGRRIVATGRGGVLREVTERHRDASAIGRRDRSSPRPVRRREGEGGGEGHAGAGGGASEGAGGVGREIG
jgi:site-specific DNA-methyltransferase (adenine-specific)